MPPPPILPKINKTVDFKWRNSSKKNIEKSAKVARFCGAISIV